MIVYGKNYMDSNKEITINAGRVGEQIGVEAVKDGRRVGMGWSWLSKSESLEAGKPVVRDRVEVDEGHRGRGIGGALARSLRIEFSKLGGVRHQVGFSEEGDKLRKRYEEEKYIQRDDNPLVVEKDY